MATKGARLAAIWRQRCPAIHRYSQVIWMHFDRTVDSNPESERYVS